MTMRETIRQAIVGYVNPLYVAAYPDIPIVYDNQPFDWNSPPAHFVEFEVQCYDGRQIGMAADPKTRYSGFVYVTAYCKAGTGSRKANEALDWFADVLKYRSLGPVRFKAPQPDNSGNPKGWFTEGLKLEFHADEA